jgi:N-acetylneuraminic acid mutarotase
MIDSMLLAAKAKPQRGLVKIATMPRRRMQHRMAHFEGKLYMSGGTSDGLTPYLQMADIYDIESGTWTTTPLAANAAKGLHGSFVRKTLNDGKYFYVVAGSQTVSGTTGSTGTNVVFREDYNAWTSGPSTSARTAFANVVDDELGRFWIFGGNVTGAADLRTTGYFNYATGAWVNVNATHPRTATGGMEAVLYDDDIYMFGGTVNTFYKFNRTTSQFTQLANLPKVTVRHAVFEHNGKIYSIGNNSINDEVLCYDIASNTWSILRGDFGLNAPATVKVGSRIFLSGGRIAGANSSDPLYEVFPDIWRPY